MPSQPAPIPPDDPSRGLTVARLMGQVRPTGLGVAHRPEMARLRIRMRVALCTSFGTQRHSHDNWRRADKLPRAALIVSRSELMVASTAEGS